MEWHINDLSLDGQFSDPQAFRLALEPLLNMRRRDPLLRDRLYCSRLLYQRNVTSVDDLSRAVRATRDKTYIQLVLEWTTKSGPFWEDNRQSNEDDYFEYQGADVTDQGLGEAARRKLVAIETNTFSFPLKSFVSSPLRVQHGLTEEPLGFIDVANNWTITQLEAALASCRVLNCWHDVQGDINRQFDQLIFPEDVMAKMLPAPFSKHVTERIYILLEKLNRLVLSSDSSGRLSPDGQEILRNCFAGTCAGRTPLFKPESETNQRVFRESLTFRDPSNTAASLFCHWHGKIQTPPIRIHFEWPRPSGQREIKVVFIGPKITKI